MLGLVDAATKELSPTVKNLLVEAVSNENEGTLEGSSDGEEKREDVVEDDGRVGSEERGQETEHPSQTDGDEDGNQDAELLRALSRALLGLRSLREGAVNFGRDEEEEQEVGRQNEESRQEEAQELGERLDNVAAASSLLSVAIDRSNNKNEEGRDSPANQVVVLLQFTGLRVTFNDLLQQNEVVG